MTQKSQHYLFHYLLKKIRSPKFTGSRFLCAVSGGVDSMSLLSLLLELKNILDLKISVVHVHHNSKNKNQKEFQDKAMNLVKEFCLKNTIPFYSPPSKGNKNNSSQATQDSANKQTNNKAVTKSVLPDQISPQKLSTQDTKHNALSSEAQMRAYRYKIFSQVFKESKSDFLVLAHSANDLLETRLIRLIRGTGEQGLSAMFFQKKDLLRPLIQINRSQIEDYATKIKLKWQEDPSNRICKNNLRNWIRHKWLKQLEKQRPGSIKALSRSLKLLSQHAEDQQKRIQNLYKKISHKHSLQRNLLLQLSTKDIYKILAYYIYKQGLKNYSLSHIQEIIKRLRGPQKNTSFQLLGKTWEINSYGIFIKEKNKV